MAKRSYNLAIETSGPIGSCSLAYGDELVASLDLSKTNTTIQPSGQRSDRRNQLDLMVAIDRITQAHRVDRSELAEVYVSIGPGSFTGLRIAVATAQALAQVLGVKLVAVPTAEVIALNAPTQNNGYDHLAVCLNFKRTSVYAQLFDLHEDTWQLRGSAIMQSVDDLLADAPRPLAIIADSALGLDDRLGDRIHRLPKSLINARSQAVWQLGRYRSKQGEYTDPNQLQPIYARPPEAQLLWDQRHNTNIRPNQPTTTKTADVIP